LHWTWMNMIGLAKIFFYKSLSYYPYWFGLRLGEKFHELLGILWTMIECGCEGARAMLLYLWQEFVGL